MNWLKTIPFIWKITISLNFRRLIILSSYLREQITGKSILSAPEETAHPVTSFEIVDPCETVESIQEADNQGNVRIKSKIKIHYEKDDVETESFLIVSTVLDEVKNVVEVFFDPELIER